MFGINSWQDLYQSRKNIAFEAIQNSDNSNLVFKLLTGLSSNFLMVKKCEIYRRICDMYGEEYPSKKVLTNGQNTSFPQRAWV